MRWRGVVCGLMVMMAMSVGLGQQIGPRFLDRSFQRPGARAMGMGGAYLLATDDATAVAWNPAALVNVKRFTLPIEVAGRAKNFRVQDIRDLIDDLKTIRDRINANPNDIQQVAQLVANAILEVRDFSIRSGAVPQGSPATLTGALAPVAGLTFGAYGLTVSSGTFGQVQVFVDQANDPDPNDNINLPAQSVQNNPINRSVYARGGVVAVSSLALAHARPLPMGWKCGRGGSGCSGRFSSLRRCSGCGQREYPQCPTRHCLHPRPQDTIHLGCRRPLGADCSAAVGEGEIRRRRPKLAASAFQPSRC